jgi:hypothetical protein
MPGGNSARLALESDRNRDANCGATNPLRRAKQPFRACGISRTRGNRLQGDSCIVWGLLNHTRSSTDAGHCLLDFPDPTEMVSLVTALVMLWAAIVTGRRSSNDTRRRPIRAVPLEADTRIWIRSQIDRCEESGAAGIRVPTAPGFSTMPAPVDWTQSKAKSVGIFYRFRFGDQGPVLSRQPNGWLIGDLES